MVDIVVKVLDALMKADQTNRADYHQLKETINSYMGKEHDDILIAFQGGSDVIMSLYSDESAGYDAGGILDSAIPILMDSLIYDDECGKFDIDYIEYVILKYIHNLVPELNQIFKSQYFSLEWSGARSNRISIDGLESDDGYSCKNCVAPQCETCRFLVGYKITSSGGSLGLETCNKVPLTDPIVVFLMKKEVEVGRNLPLNLPEGQTKRLYNRVKELEDRCRKAELQCILGKK